MIHIVFLVEHDALARFVEEGKRKTMFDIQFLSKSIVIMSLG